MIKERAPRNRTLTCSQEEVSSFSKAFSRLEGLQQSSQLANTIVHQDTFEAVRHLPPAFVDLLVLDPPYNISKNFHGHFFQEKEKEGYRRWFGSVLDLLTPTLKRTASVYVCSDW